MADQPGGRRFRPGRPDGFVWGMALGQTVSWGVLYYGFSVLLVPMQADLGWSRTVLVGGFTAAVAVSGLFAPLVGRWLDRGYGRAVMGLGSVAAVLLTVAWSRTDAVPVYFAVWAAIGVVMALVLYEPAFTLIAQRSAPNHHRALTTLTLVAGTASFVFQPLTSLLTAAHGWRTTLVVLAVVLAAVTVPLHVTLLAGAPGPVPAAAGGPAAGTRMPVDRRFWALTAAFAGAAVTSLGASVLLVAYLVDHGWTLGRAALAAGLLGLMQLPGRMLFAPLRGRLAPAALARVVLGLPGVGVLVLLASGGTALVWVAIPILGMSQGIGTLFRATLMVDLYGTERIGALNGRSALPVVLARAFAPLGVSFLVASSGGYALPFILLAGVAAVAVGLAAGALTGGRGAEPTRLQPA